MAVVTIEELSPRYFGLVASWLSKCEINRWLTAEWRTQAVTATLIAMAVRNRRNRLFLVRCDDQPCGLTALADIDVADRTGMVWYVLGERPLSNREITSNGLRQVVSKCFQELKLESLYAWTMEDNVASIRVLRKVGFRAAGRIRRAVSSNGCQVDRVYFDLLASEWQAS